MNITDLAYLIGEKLSKYYPRTLINRTHTNHMIIKINIADTVLNHIMNNPMDFDNIIEFVGYLAFSIFLIFFF